MIKMKNQVVECDEWPAVFSAGPGTGKSTYSREHAAWLKSQGDRVLLTTFGRFAVKQLNVPGVESRTIDSFYWWRLKEAGMLKDKLLTSRAFREREKAFAVLLRDEGYRKELQSRYDAIVVDEGQDANYSELKNLWSVCGGRLHVFADIDQCIYEFRSAEPERLLDFCNYQNITPIPLTHTYRLTKQVLKASQNVITHNVKRFSVPLETDKEGPEIEFEHTIDDIGATMRRLKEVNSNDVAVLTRNAKGRMFLKDFWEQGLSRKAVSHKPYCGTIHGAKGLEWEHVFIVRADAFQFSFGPLEEERRVFYTAMTRSCRFLHISAFSPICFVREALNGD